MNDEERPIGERMATLEQCVRDLNIYMVKEIAELKSILNPKLDKVDALWEWREGHVRDEDRRERRQGRLIAIYSIIITVVVSAVNILIKVKF